MTATLASWHVKSAVSHIRYPFLQVLYRFCTTQIFVHIPYKQQENIVAIKERLPQKTALLFSYQCIYIPTTSCINAPAALHNNTKHRQALSPLHVKIMGHSVIANKLENVLTWNMQFADGHSQQSVSWNMTYIVDVVSRQDRHTGERCAKRQTSLPRWLPSLPNRWWEVTSIGPSHHFRAGLAKGTCHRLS